MISNALALSIKEIAYELSPAGSRCYSDPALRAHILSVRAAMDTLRHELWRYEGDQRVYGANRTVLEVPAVMGLSAP